MPESVTLTVTVKLPVVPVGVPDTVHPEAPPATLRPAGSGPLVELRAQVYGAVPPVTGIGCEYTVPMVAEGSVTGLTTRSAATLIVKVWLLLCGVVSESLTVRVTVKLPVAVGVPPRVAPVVDIPAGSPVAVQV